MEWTWWSALMYKLHVVDSNEYLYNSIQSVYGSHKHRMRLRTFECELYESF